MTVATILLSAFFASNTPVSVVVHHEGDGAEAPAVLFESVLRSAVSNRDGHVAVLKNDLWLPKQEEQLQALVDEAMKKQSEGRAAFEELEAELAIQAYKVAAETLLSQTDIPERQAQALEAAAEYASVLQQLGEEDKAREIFRSILFVNSSYSGDDFKRLTDDDVSLLQDEEMALAFDVPGALMVTQGASAVEVWIDGKMVGVTPLTIDSLTPGLHFYALKRDGFQRRSGRFRLKSGETKKIQGQLVRVEAHKTFSDTLPTIDWQTLGNGEPMRKLAASVSHVQELLLIKFVITEPGKAKVRALRWNSSRGFLQKTIDLETLTTIEDFEVAAVRIATELFPAQEAGQKPQLWSAHSSATVESEEPASSGSSVWLWAGAGVAAGLGLGTLATLTGGMATYVVYSSAPTSSNSGQESENRTEDPAARYVILGY